MVSVAVSTLGCPKNLADSEALMDTLTAQGFDVTDDIDMADVLVLNTCGFISPAIDESVNVIVQYRDYIAERPILFAVVGCLVQRYRDELMEQISGVDIWLGVSDLPKLPDKIRELMPDAELMPQKNYDYGQSRLTPGYFAYIKVADGCNYGCAFCVIPSIRGRYISRPVADIVANAKVAARFGAKEICLVAQDVSGYGKDLSPHSSLVSLLGELEKVEGIQWIRLMYLYPDRIDDALIDAVAGSKKICKYLDIPIQHVSTPVLRRMGRPETRETIFALLDKLRSRIPDLFVRTTVIVGFPGETEEDFNVLYDGMKELAFGRMGVFMYSDEEGTPAFEMTDKVPQKVMEKRYHALMQLQRDISKQKLASICGKDITVLIEDKRDDGEYVGRSQWDAPEIDGSVIVHTAPEVVLYPGDMVTVNITESYEYDIEGEYLP